MLKVVGHDIRSSESWQASPLRGPRSHLREIILRLKSYADVLTSLVMSILPNAK